MDLDRRHFASGVLAASIFHFGVFTVGQARDYLRTRGVSQRQSPSHGAVDRDSRVDRSQRQRQARPLAP